MSILFFSFFSLPWVQWVLKSQSAGIEVFFFRSQDNKQGIQGEIRDTVKLRHQQSKPNLYNSTTSRIVKNDHRYQMILVWWQRLHMILTFTTITMWLFHPLGSWRKYCLDTIPTLPMAVGEFPTKYRILWHQTVSFRECSSTLASFFYCKGGCQPGGRRTWSCIGWFFLW